VRDEEVRGSCFAALDVLQARFGADIPYWALLEGFSFRGARVPFLNRAYGIYRARIQTGPAALSLNSSYKQNRYQDEETPDGVLYRYQDGPVENHFNSSLRKACLLRVPVVYFIGTRLNYYRPEYPAFIDDDDPAARRVRLTFGRMIGPYDEREPSYIDDVDERRYVVRQVKQRLHQAQFRGAVLPAYHESCAICRLREAQLLDAAHIVADTQELGRPLVSNGLSLCTIHHRAYDQNLIGVSPDHQVHVSRRLLEDEDGPMLELLKAHHRRSIVIPDRNAWRPDRERLAVRFDQFLRSA
jgi:putative restriction endonuclease